MHIPEGFIDLTTSAGAAAVAGGGLWASLRAAGRDLRDRLVPLAGLTAAFVFALQMLNFPVAAGTTGHLLGGALAAILLGPWLGIVAVTVVVVVQALLFADGGLTALGLNIVNMAIVTALVGWLLFRAIVRVLPNRAGVILGTLAAAWASVVASSMAFSLEYAIGGQGGVDPGLVLGSMVGIHSLIGIGEGLITATAVGAVLAARPDLVRGAGGIGDLGARPIGVSRRATGSFIATGVGVAVLLIAVVAPNAASDPDGLERVAADTGFAAAADASDQGLFAGYGVTGLENEALGTVIAGLVGLGLTFAGGLIISGLVRRSRHGVPT